MRKRNILLLGMVVFVAAATRLLPHPPNVAPIGAMALFGTAFFGRKAMAIFIPFLALFASDLVLNNVVYSAWNPEFILFSKYSTWVYSAFFLTFLLGSQVFKKMTFSRMIVGSVGASMIFFLITNFGSWLAPINGYPQNMAGLISALGAGVPFLRNTLLGDLFFSGAFFSVYYLVVARQKNLATS